MSDQRAVPIGKTQAHSRRTHAQVIGERAPLLPDDSRSSRRGGVAASKQGWKLFSEDVRQGRFFALVGLAFIIAGAISFGTSPEYTVSTVTVEGSKVLSVEQANEIAGVGGQNIFLIDSAAVQRRLAEKAALLKGVAVDLELPNRVIIRVQERRPAVVWVIGDGNPLLASDDLVVVGNATTLEGFVTIFDRGPITDSLTIGAPMPVHKADAADTAQQIYVALPQATGLQLRQLEWAPDNGITAITATGQRIEFGTGERLDEKIKIVQSVVREYYEHNRSWNILDVRSVERPSVRR